MIVLAVDITIALQPTPPIIVTDSILQASVFFICLSHLYLLLLHSFICLDPHLPSCPLPSCPLPSSSLPSVLFSLCDSTILCRVHTFSLSLSLSMCFPNPALILSPFIAFILTSIPPPFRSPVL